MLKRLSSWSIAIVVIATAVIAGVVTGAEAADSGDITIETVANRADLISDGDALIRITLPKDADIDDLSVWVATSRHEERKNGDRDVTSEFAQRANGHIEGVVTGLRVGTNEVTARLADGRGAWLTVTNHPRGGPVFSGPQLQPWVCQEGAVDAQCNAEPEISWLYKSTNPLLAGLQEFAIKPAKGAGGKGILIISGRKGKEKTVAVTPEGERACLRYKAIREQLLVRAVRGLGFDENVLSQIASNMRALSGHYDQAARSAASL